MKEKIRNRLERGFQAIGISGVVCSWVTLAFIWLGLVTASYVGYVVTAGLFGLALAVGKS
ncbi:MAG: hypothetical protein ACE5LV_00960 [Candidatus Aminicenantales bacterium]